MADFTAIESQEQLDAVIGERIKRERETMAKKYEGYISPEEHQKQIGDLNTQLQGANDKIANHNKELADRDSKIKAYESHSVKTRIANEVGLSFDAVDFIKGDDEETIRKSAQTLAALVGGNNVAPLASTEQLNADSETAALKKTLRGLKGE